MPPGFSPPAARTGCLSSIRLDPDHDPSARIDRQGGFTLLISSTGDYVLLAGEDVSSAVVLTDENHHRKVIHIDGNLAEMDAGVLYVMP